MPRDSAALWLGHGKSRDTGTDEKAGRAGRRCRKWWWLVVVGGGWSVGRLVGSESGAKPGMSWKLSSTKYVHRVMVLPGSLCYKPTTSGLVHPVPKSHSLHRRTYTHIHTDYTYIHMHNPVSYCPPRMIGRQ